MSPTPATSTRPQSRPSFRTRRRSSPIKSLLRTPTTMTLHSRVCFAKLTEYIAITLHEKTCLSVCRRRKCPTERSDPLETERGDPLSKETRKHRLGLCSTNKKSKFLQSAKQELISSRLRQKKSTKIVWNCWISTRRTLSRSSRRSSTTRSRASSRTIIAAKFGITWSSSEKSHWNGRVKEVSEFYIRHYCKTKISRRSEHYTGTFWPNTGIAKWNKLYEWFKGLLGCWINSQWKFPRYQSTSVIPTSSNSWRNAKPFFWSAEPQRRAAKHLGHTWYIGKRFCKSRCVIISTLSSRIASMEFIDRGAASFIQWTRVKGKNKIKIWNASLDRQPKIQSSSVEETLHRIMGQTNNDCRFRIFISTNSPHQPRLLAGR